MYKLEGIVVKGKNRGKKLGFPTANIELYESVPDGIYISTTEIDGKIYRSVTFVGKAITFAEIEVFAETYILDFSDEIYGKKIYLNLIIKIRENEKFENVDDLTIQIEKDVKITEEYFKKNPLIKFTD